MKKILLLVNHRYDGETLITKLKAAADFEVVVLSRDDGDLTDQAIYLQKLSGVSVIVSLIGPLDVDLDLLGLFDAIETVEPTLTRFIILSTAGIDNEVQGNLDYHGIANVREYLNQQRYAVKLVDESEIPYIVLRPVTIVDHKVGPVQIIKEGQPVPSGIVSRETIDLVIADIIIKNQYINESLGLVEQEGSYNG